MTTVWLDEADCRLDDFIELVTTKTVPADYPLAAGMDAGILVYDATMFGGLDSAERRGLQAELVGALLHGPGVVLLRKAFTDHAVVDRVTDVFEALIVHQRSSGTASGDHFAKPGANDRIWNALEKLARRDPEAFCHYYANDAVALICDAWLGPGYQMTSQVNVVNPGGAAQVAHVDYHLGFQANDVSLRYPAHVHKMSPILTLQGAIAHCDMPMESGPTLYLPHSQKYPLGYLAWRRDEFRRYFDEHHVQLPLAKGDAVFFNPSLFHAAGHNRSNDIRRMGNLLQISSAFGRAMESVDRTAIVTAIYPTLLTMIEPAKGNVIAAAAEGYAFPTNLDRDQPIGGLAPASQADILRQALDGEWAPGTLVNALDGLVTRHRSH